MNHLLIATSRWNSNADIDSFNSSGGPTVRLLYRALGDKAQRHYAGSNGDGSRERFTHAELVAARAAFVAGMTEAGDSACFALGLLDSCVAHQGSLWLHFL